MANKIWECTSPGHSEQYFALQCPGCHCGHRVRTKSLGNKGPLWTWNGSMDKPTFYPSVDCNRSDPSTRCHSFITDGNIQFLSDCYHSLKGQTVELPDWED